MQDNTYDIPVLLVTFNRPDYTVKVLERIKELQPRKLYVFSDGARAHKPNEHIAVNQCRELFNSDNINWDCDIQTWFCDANMGCGRAVSSAISWMFASEEYGIILEDDCLPDITFFEYSAAMLHKYAQEPRVMHIAGTRWNEEFDTGSASHFFSRVGHVWGWATWKRAWDLYDFEMSGWHAAYDRQMLYRQLKSRIQTHFWIDCFDRIFKKDTYAKDTWDYQWQYALFKNQGLSVVPQGNLISNIGITGAHANAHSEQKDIYNRKTIAWNIPAELISNPDIKANEAFDSYHITNYFLKASNRIHRLRWHLKRLYHLTKSSEINI
ncbi:nucleotide-diphospho-sugar transferase [Mucilaginibacter sp. Bleaf8]|uniref:nucleotide-diphospho-sugar transferase n=1 Tax=Mucilaginibacter sp. Bleaf8 TaxID=2834430 RepID=UPI001BCE0845|nr:nucleotide-diphospho-sugar transferase [Mucilaginibacter sp. Bleaf8]MBS7566820.1 nucleotide-diphospho-sugar transferase [Mucilaginibacter sp. Bleaf8]